MGAAMTAIIVPFASEPLTQARKDSRDYQLRAADPANSAWVSANAGTGKTYVLVLRVLRLLLSGASASSILCLTFTKAAAAEMSNRLIARLGDWAAMSDAALAKELSDILQRQPSAEEFGLARCLFARVLDAPGGLKIMTIHAFCDRVLRRFPLEAGVPPGFTILTDEDRHAALQEATDAILRKAAGDSRSQLGKALTTIVAYASEDRFQDLLRAVAAKQETLRRLIHRQRGADAFDGIEAALRAMLGAARDDTPESILARQASTAPDTLITTAIAMWRDGSKNDQKLADAMMLARGKADAARVEALAAVFLTKEGTPRADKNFITKALRESHAGTAEALCRARDDFFALEIRRRAAGAAMATAALLRLADAVIDRYEEAKAQRSAMDFDGLIAKTEALFQRSDAAAWVLFRLDADLRHILVDEAQDTSPAQWALVRALTAEFFAGEGVEDRPTTLFAVGDEKQSIYRFQGADPRQFAGTGADYSARAIAARQPWIEAPLTLSYRTTKVVLDAVDLVFADGARVSGLTADGRAVRHFAHREGEAGLVEIWDTEKPDTPEQVSAWEPYAENAAAAPPAKRLAARIARQVRHWLDSGDVLPSLARPVRAGDILILVRKREPFASQMVRALKAHGIPVAGADRMKLTEQLAVMDLVALGDALLLREDDLTLAALLKSPVFGLDDDDLFAIGHGRPGSLWDALTAQAAAKPAYAVAAAQLEQWRDAATGMRPFDFYKARLESDGVRERLLARLGPDIADAIDEFLNLALSYERGETPTLQGFLHWLRASEPEVKRDMEAERDEVRVMTVHGSKGLEANIVFLADTCSVRGAGRGALIELEPRDAPPVAGKVPVWVIPGARLIPPVAEACEREARAEREEYQRLLYVAMTRARDRLYVAGFEGLNGRESGCWYDLISDGLEARLSETTDYAGNPVRRMECAQLAAPKVSAGRHASAAAGAMPVWSSQIQGDAGGPILINPSRLDLDGALHSGDGLRPRGEAITRGALIHRLLELLPRMPAAAREKAGRAFLEAEGASLTSGDRRALLSGCIAILGDPVLGGFFGAESHAEVPLTAEIPPIWHGGPPLLISGQIDRLVIRGKDMLILDFKSGGSIPQAPELTPESYLAQLAAYRLGLSRLFMGNNLHAAILWTDRPQLMAIPTALIDRGERLLYESVRSRHLD
jgi:ATP-dependent helicase/nuclease subunit A